MSQFEQRANIKFMCRLGKSASETLSALQQVYGDTALKKSTVYDWFSRFKNGQEKLEDDQRSGRPSTSRTAGMIENVRQLIQCDRRMTIVELAQEFGISIVSIHAILSDDLTMRHVSAKFVPRQLTTDQKDCHMMVAGDLFEKSMQDPTFLTKIVTGDESWVFIYQSVSKVSVLIFVWTNWQCGISLRYISA
jgi:transposase